MNPIRKRESLMVFEKVSDMMEVCASKVPPRGRNWRKAQPTGLEV